MSAGRRRPAWLALALAVLGGVASAVQSAVNAELGVRAGSAPVAALVNNVVAAALMVAGLLALPSLRSGLRALSGARLPWWAYLGGLGGAFLVAVVAYVVPVTGVAVFTIAQVVGAAVGGLGVDRAGLAATGRLPLSATRLAGAALGVLAVACAQLGRPIGELALGSLALALIAGVAVAVQSALNGRIAAVSGSAAATVANFAVSTPALLAFAAAAGALTTHRPAHWPTGWYLYVGGALGVLIVVALVVAVPVIGVLRTSLALVGGQLGGAVVLDAALPVGAGPTPAVLLGVCLTAVAAGVASWRRSVDSPG